MQSGERRIKWKILSLRNIVLFQIAFFILSLLYVSGYHADLVMYFTYLTRPMWDSPKKGLTTLQHFYAEGVDQQTLCGLHGWTYLNNATKNTTTNTVIGAVIFANELDLLEIRTRELYPVVDKFVIVEADRTFTNKPKPTVFFDNRERYAFAADKIEYALFKTPPVEQGEQSKGKYLEGKIRDFVTEFLKEKGVVTGDVVIMADSDEVPSRHTISLIKHCKGFPQDMHLGMRNYLYSFEFPITHQAGYIDNFSPATYNWVPRVHIWDSNSSVYFHGRKSDFLLVESGWHCSFCFRYLEDFSFKMTAYAHADRVRHAYLLKMERIQQIVCAGSDIFGLFPEAFTFYDLFISWFDPVKSNIAVHLPIELVQHAEKYMFLLPGNCIRELKAPS